MSLKDLFLNDAEETPIHLEVSVSGTLPNWLTGTYYKVGNGKFTLPGGFQMNHLMDGYCIIYQYEIESNKIRYRSKYLNSDAYKEAMEFGKPTHAELGTRQFPNPNKNIISRSISSILPTDLSDNNAGNIFSYRDQIYANNESFFLHRIDPETLQSVAKLDLRKCDVLGTSGHYLKDSKGAIFNYVVSAKRGSLKPKIIQFSAPTDNKFDYSAVSDNTDFDLEKHVKVVAKMPKSSMASISATHSFGMSENYFVVLEQPMTLNLLSFVIGQIKGKSILDCTHWNQEAKTKFRVMDRSTSKLIKTKYMTEAFFYIHMVNAYEEDGYLIIDIITYENCSDVVNCFMMCKLRTSEVNPGTPGILKRFVLPIKDHKNVKSGENLVKLSCTKATATKLESDDILLLPETLFEIPMDLARINENLIGQKYRFLYSMAMHEKELHKLDIETKLVKVWKSTNDAHFVGEPLFVANPEATDEDDGIVISLATEAGKNNSIMIFFDAKSFTEIARAEFDKKVTVGNHGLFVFKK